MITRLELTAIYNNDQKRSKEPIKDHCKLIYIPQAADLNAFQFSGSPPPSYCTNVTIPFRSTSPQAVFAFIK